MRGVRPIRTQDSKQRGRTSITTAQLKVDTGTCNDEIDHVSLKLTSPKIDGVTSNLLTAHWRRRITNSRTLQHLLEQA